MPTFNGINPQGFDLSMDFTLDGKTVDLYDLSGDGSKFFVTVVGKYGSGDTDCSCNFFPHTYSAYKIEALKREMDSLTDSSFSYLTGRTAPPDVSFVMKSETGGVDNSSKFRISQGDKNVSFLPSGVTSTAVNYEMLSFIFYNLIDKDGKFYQKMSVDLPETPYDERLSLVYFIDNLNAMKKGPSSNQVSNVTNNYTLQGKTCVYFTNSSNSFVRFGGTSTTDQETYYNNNLAFGNKNFQVKCSFCVDDFTSSNFCTGFLTGCISTGTGLWSGFDIPSARVLGHLRTFLNTPSSVFNIKGASGTTMSPSLNTSEYGSKIPSSSTGVTYDISWNTSNQFASSMGIYKGQWYDVILMRNGDVFKKFIKHSNSSNYINVFSINLPSSYSFPANNSNVWQIGARTSYVPPKYGIRNYSIKVSASTIFVEPSNVSLVIGSTHGKAATAATTHHSNASSPSSANYQNIGGSHFQFYNPRAAIVAEHATTNRPNETGNYEISTWTATLGTFPGDYKRCWGDSSWNVAGGYGWDVSEDTTPDPCSTREEDKNYLRNKATIDFLNTSESEPIRIHIYSTFFDNAFVYNNPLYLLFPLLNGNISNASGNGNYGNYSKQSAFHFFGATQGYNSNDDDYVNASTLHWLDNFALEQGGTNYNSWCYNGTGESGLGRRKLAECPEFGEHIALSITNITGINSCDQQYFIKFEGISFKEKHRNRLGEEGKIYGLDNYSNTTTANDWKTDIGGTLYPNLIYEWYENTHKSTTGGHYGVQKYVSLGSGKNYVVDYDFSYNGNVPVEMNCNKWHATTKYWKWIIIVFTKGHTTNEGYGTINEENMNISSKTFRSGTSAIFPNQYMKLSVKKTKNLENEDYIH